MKAATFRKKSGCKTKDTNMKLQESLTHYNLPKSETREQELEHCIFMAKSQPFGTLTESDLYGSAWVNKTDLHRIYVIASKSIKASLANPEYHTGYLSAREIQEWIWGYNDYLFELSTSDSKPTPAVASDPLENTMANLFKDNALLPTGNAQGARYEQV